MAVLENVETSLRLDRQSGREILTNPKFATAKLLKTSRLSQQRVTIRSHHLESFRPDVQMTLCYGWTQLSGMVINTYLPTLKDF
jgi:hypothetical protein